MKVVIPALRGSDSYIDRANYLNYLFRISNPALIDPKSPITVYFGAILVGKEIYSQKTTWRAVRFWRGSPFGPILTARTAMA